MSLGDDDDFESDDARLRRFLEEAVKQARAEGYAQGFAAGIEAAVKHHERMAKVETRNDSEIWKAYHGTSAEIIRSLPPTSAGMGEK